MNARLISWKIFFVSGPLESPASKPPRDITAMSCQWHVRQHPPMAKIRGRPSNVVPETGSFDIDVSHRISFPNKTAAWKCSGTTLGGWTYKLIQNPNSPKLADISGILAGVRIEGSSKRFHVDG